MAKSARPMQRTPARKNQSDAPAASANAAAPEVAATKSKAAKVDPDYLLAGTGCVGGHEQGQELIDRRLGRLPSARTTKIGLGVSAWIFFGMIFMAPPAWPLAALAGAVSWVAYSTYFQHRAGHRGRCRRTRAWRYAWGGLVPVKPASR